MRECGMPEEQIAEQLAIIRRAQPVELWACNVETFAVFVGCVADWSVDMLPSGARIWRGLPSPAIHAALQLAGIPADRWPEVSSDLRQMAHAAAGVLNDRER